MKRKDSVSHFGSKAKLLGEETDVLDLGGFDSSTYLSEIDGLHENQPEKPKLNSIIVKPDKPKSRSNSLHHKRKHSSQRVEVDKRTRGHIADFNSTNRNRVSDIKVRVVNNTTSQVAPAKQTETCGTQTDRTGPCKCALSSQQRNQRKRLENKINKQIVDTLERVDIIKFSN